MLWTVGQIALVVAIAGYFGYWVLSMRRRNGQCWESLIAKLQDGLNFQALSEHFPWKEGLHTTPEETWERLGGVKGLKAIYKNAGVMLEIANFAARNADNVDQVLLQNIHADATQIRMCVMRTLAHCLVSQATETVRVNTFQVASMYTGLAARMTELLQASAGDALPAFVAAA